MTKREYEGIARAIQAARILAGANGNFALNALSDMLESLFADQSVNFKRELWAAATGRSHENA